MKKKEIVIPTGKILGGVVIGTSFGVSVVADKALRGLQINRIAKYIIRYTVSTSVAIPATEIAMRLANNSNMDIRVKSKKDFITNDGKIVHVHGNMKKNRKRISKAVEMWDSILPSAFKLYEWDKGDNNEDSHDYTIDINMVKELNKVMIKLGKNFNFEYIPINIDEYDLMSEYNLMREIMNRMDTITNVLKYCHSFYNSNTVCEIDNSVEVTCKEIDDNDDDDENDEDEDDDYDEEEEEEEDGKEDIDEDEDMSIPPIAATSDEEVVPDAKDDSEELSNHDELIEMLVNCDVDIDKVDRGVVSKVFDQFKHGIIGVKEACDTIISSIKNPNEFSKETQDIIDKLLDNSSKWSAPVTDKEIDDLLRPFITNDEERERAVTCAVDNINSKLVKMKSHKKQK